MVTLTRPEGSNASDFAPSRRALGAMFFAGYALAAVSAEAEAIHTDADGLTVAELDIPTGDSPLPAYVARPNASGRFPVVLVVSEVFGVHEYIRDTCRRLAKLGYVAVAPAFFHRAGDPAPLTDFDQIQKIVATATNDQVLGDIAATLTWLKAQDFVDTGRMAITGFCWGGAVVWMAAARFPEFKAGAAWYGRLSRPAPDQFLGAEQRAWPMEVVGDLHAPVLGFYAGKDKGIPLTDVEAMRAKLRDAHKKGDLIVYPEAQHGFHADYRSSYDAPAAKDAWARMLDWFAKNGVKPGARRKMFG